MASPTVTYSFVNGQTSDGTQVNQNFTDILNAITDGSKDLTVNSITATTKLISPIFQSTTSNFAVGGIVRLANADTIKWRNAGNSGDNALGVGSSDAIPAYGGIDICNISTSQTLTNKTLTSPTINTPTISGGTFTGVSGFAAGTAAAPSIVNSAAPTYGIYFPTSAVAISIGGSAVLTVNSGGTIATGGVTGSKFVSSAANVASAGTIQLANTDTIKFRNSGNSADISFTTGSTDSIASYAGIDLCNISSTQTLTNKTLTTPLITGVTDGSSGAAGKVGEVISAFSGGGGSPALVSSTGTNQFFDVASISLTAGDWDITIQGQAHLNGATLVFIDVGIGTVTGNDATGLINGYTFIELANPTSSNDSGFSLTIPKSISSTTTYYFKGDARYSAGGPPQIEGFMWARRQR